MNGWKDKLLIGLGEWVRLNLLLLLCMVAMRPLFFLEVYFRLGLEWRQLLTVMYGSLFDLLLVSRIFTFGLVPFLLVHFFFPKTAKGIFKGLIVVYAVVVALLAEYYCDLTMPLDHVVLVYSVEELKTTVFASSSSISWAQVLWFLLYVVLAILLLLKRRPAGAKSPQPRATPWEMRSEELGVRSILVAGLFVVLLFIPYKRIIREEKIFSNRSDFCLAVNQPSYSYIKITDYWRDEGSRRDEEEFLLSPSQLADYQAGHPKFEYDLPGYPLYRKANDPDVLSPFFNSTSDGLPPNLVFIIVESMGRRLTGVTRPQLSFTPFIDSLAANGLFWTNCFSTSERTFGVLPSVFASAPHGRYGFAAKLPMPKHHSLMLDLERNGYTTSFFYGGGSEFDHYDHFMEINHVNDIVIPERLVADSGQYHLLADNYRWGLDDDQLFDCAIRYKTDKPDHRPHADIYLTLSSHEPFLVDSIEHYEELVKAMVEQVPDLDKKERDNVLRNLNIYATFLYVDQSVRHLVDYYASQPDFSNTVFIITGDHRMGPVPTGISMRSYNVPLVLWSPLVKRPKTMGAVVSHLDITPSLNAWLNAQYDYAIDDHCHWLGTSFDTVSEYRNTRKLSFMRNNRDVDDYYSGKFAVNKNTLIMMDSCVVGYGIDNPVRLQQYQEELENFEAVSRFVVQHDLLMP
ncbi:MAG: LTA synthase family protein [Bacteroidales bacterium]|nr:LTA synthase family protein [Bacteroidales bacterium]